MISPLLKNETIDLSLNFDVPLEQLSIATNWNPTNIYYRNFLGIKTKKVVENVDLDFTCFMFNEDQTLLDSIYSPKHNSWLIKNNFPLGKTASNDGAIQYHDFESEPENTFKKAMTIDTKKINNEIDSIFFYLTFDLRKVKSPDFSAVKELQMTFFGDKNLQKKVSEYNITTEKSPSKNEGILVLGKLVRKNGNWKFKTIGKTIEESDFIQTKGI